MGRPKGSKNKSKMNSQISAAERTDQIEKELATLTEQEEVLTLDIADMQADLSAKRADLRTVKRNIKKLEVEKDSIAEAVKEEEQKNAAAKLVAQYFAEGKTVDELKTALEI